MKKREISIHAPLTGSDALALTCLNILYNFNPRSPYGERHESTAQIEADLQFQSTLPLRGATTGGPVVMPETGISIHAPLTGSDWICCGVDHPAMISIHAPLTGSDPQARRLLI